MKRGHLAASSNSSLIKSNQGINPSVRQDATFSPVIFKQMLEVTKTIYKVSDPLGAERVKVSGDRTSTPDMYALGKQEIGLCLLT